MPVAKTYAPFAIDGEPFQENGRAYVNIITPKGLKKVRWYTDAEYKRMYPDAIVEHHFNARHAFGFGDKGYITLYKGNDVKEWAENDRTNIWFNLIFGYYTPSKLETPKILNNIEAVRLNWQDVNINDTEIKPCEEVQKLVASLLSDESASTFQGTVNEWLQKTVTVNEKQSQDSRFGTKYTYILSDDNDNIYVWETGAKDYPIAKVVSLKMKVKEHKEMDNKKVTVVWYCKEC